MTIFPKRRLFLGMVIFAVITSIALFQSANAQVVIDMSGQAVNIPQALHKVFGSAPPVNALIYTLDPRLLAGWNLPLSPSQRQYLDPAARQLPVLGGWFGQGYNADIGTILQVHPDLIVFWYPYMGPQASVVSKLRALGLPVFNIKLHNLTDYMQAYRLLGEVFNKQKRADKLIQYLSEKNDALQKLRTRIPEQNRVTVYFAGNPDGLRSGCDESMPTATIQWAGGENVFHCTVNHFQGYQQVSLGQLLRWNPKVIVTDNPIFLSKVYTNPAWAPLQAVQRHRIYYIPQQPFSWFNRLYSFMQILGAQWLAHKLYPQQFAFNDKDIQHFYQQFLGVKISDTQLREIMQP
ncbi:ABC transporter substrate-binding protein [Acidithiobacillus thiooxidans]|uniref:Iron ABC transporter substrate-binding protein n=1 Tax=Acidithiobacillus thiooxidans TaxID=930 RepID=A0A1C2IKF5_ACITH|nr:ABC transporter substrate-binding protein [Acidithiobacillus thiooxidans]OCX76497.1 iron ABC transporter substrate-binding protein [Acidithiobacillus thiooxidans]OCX79693.1 iron ABC transporter substrate-binding protein [Acidithiobacillus thiooxidans]